jgi:hypothetical protein
MKNEFDISLEIGLKVDNHEIKALSSTVGKNELHAMLSGIELKRYRRYPPTPTGGRGDVVDAGQHLV